MSLGRTGGEGVALREVVAVQPDVEPSHRGRDALELLDRGRQPFRQWRSPCQQANEHEVVRATVALDDLVRQTPDRARKFGAPLQLNGTHRGDNSVGKGIRVPAQGQPLMAAPPPLAASRDRLKGLTKISRSPRIAPARDREIVAVTGRNAS